MTQADLFPGTHSAAEADQSATAMRSDQTAAVFQRIVDQEKAAEAVRLAKRAKRQAAANPDAAPATPDLIAEATIVADADKKVTKKDRKLADSRFAEQQQHRSANETARMATSGLIGRFSSKGKKEYSWMKGGGASAAPTPSKPNSTSASASAAATPAMVRTAAAPKEQAMAQWDETKDSGIEFRDVQMVLQMDGKAEKSRMRSYIKEY